MVIEPQFEYVGKFTEDNCALVILDANILPIDYSDPIRGEMVSDSALKVFYNYIDKRGNTILPTNEVICKKH